MARATSTNGRTAAGRVVEALQAAWSAIANTPIPQDDPAKGVFRVDHLRLALDGTLERP
jgi:ADP-ribosyl-[dinitrogen reductase] hydrolase